MSTESENQRRLEDAFLGVHDHIPKTHLTVDTVELNDGTLMSLWAMTSEKYSPGDIVRVEYLDYPHPYAVEAEVIQTEEGSGVIYTPGKSTDQMTFISWFEQHPEEYKVSLVKKADRPLPTKPGLYAIRDKSWSEVWRLTTEGWYNVGKPELVDKADIQALHNLHGLRRLTFLED